MNKIFAFVFLLVSFTFADDMDGRLIPNFKIVKGDTNFSFNRNVEIRNITFNDSSIVTREKVAIANPTFRVSSKNVNGEINNIGME